MTQSLRALVICLTLAAAVPAAAHQLIVFASVQGEALVIEAKFSSGKKPKTGAVRVYDGAETLMHDGEISEAGVYRVKLSDIEAGLETGLKVEVDTGSGHTDYWILTPGDIAQQRAASAKTGE